MGRLMVHNRRMYVCCVHTTCVVIIFYKFFCVRFPGVNLPEWVRWWFGRNLLDHFFFPTCDETIMDGRVFILFCSSTMV